MKDFESKILECWNAIKFPLATLIVLIISHNKITVCLINPFIEYLNDFNLINTDNLIFITKISVIILILFYLHKSVRKNYILGKRSIFWILVLFGYFFLITQNKMLSNNKIIEVLKFLNLIPYILICYPLAFLIFNGVINYPSWAEHFYKNIISQLNKIINYIFNKKQTPKKAKNSFYLDEIN